MSNPHYSNSTSLSPGSRARATDVEEKFDQVEAGFDSVEAALAQKADTASPALTGSATADELTVNDLVALTSAALPANATGVTAAVSENSTKLATTGFVQALALALTASAQLPGQSGNGGKFLGTNGVTASWKNISVNVQTFSSSGNWTKPPNMVFSLVDLLGGGGGGGGGAKGATGTARSGGASGGAGQHVSAIFDAASLADTVAVTIGAGGAAGAPQTGTGIGGAGGPGGASNFGALLSAAGGGGGGGGTTGVNAGGAGPITLADSSTTTQVSPGTGQRTTGSGAGTAFAALGCGSVGGCGGSLSSGSAILDPGAGAASPHGLSGAPAAGGAASVSGAGAAGAAGVRGGSGAGGGATNTGATSGAGGAGGDGYCRVITICIE